MAVSMIGPKFYAWDRNGKPLAFGKLYTYQARTNTPKPTYQSEDQVVENTNPVILNGEGYANVYLDGSYKMVLKDDKDNEIWSADPVTSAQAEEWVNCMAASYVSSTSFIISGNVTDKFQEGRRVRLDNNLTDYSYSKIISSLLSSGETVVTIFDPVVSTGILSVCTSIVGDESSFSKKDLGKYTSYECETVNDMISGKLLNGENITFADGNLIITSKYNLEVKQKWEFSITEPSAGFYLSGSGGWFIPVRKVKTRANIREFGLEEYVTPGIGAGPECSALIAAAFADGVKELTIDDECYIGTHGTVISESDITLKGSGRIWVDWAILPAGLIGTPTYPLTFSGDNVVIKKVRSDRVGGAVPWVEDEYAAMLLMTGENATVRHTDANYHRNYCFAFNSGKKIKFIGNTGKGLVDGLSQQFGIHCLLQMQDNLRAQVSHNEGGNWTNGILAGLSPQRSHITNNVFSDCGNHCIYVSSGDYSYVSNNEAYGDYTDIKVRGDWNTCMSNKVFGGSFSMTNRVVDSESTGYAANSIVCIGNEVHANRDLSVGLAIQSRTGFDGPVKRISCIGNSVECTGDNMPNGILILFESIESINYSGNDLDCLGTVTDGVRITPTDGITTSKIKSLSVSGGHSIGSLDQAYSFTAEKLVASGFIAKSGGGSGVNAGGVTVRSDRSSFSAFDIEVTNNIYCINFGSGITSNLNCGTLTRPVGGTLPHVLSPTFTPNEGSELVKVN